MIKKLWDDNKEGSSRNLKTFPCRQTNPKTLPKPKLWPILVPFQQLGCHWWRPRVIWWRGPNLWFPEGEGRLHGTIYWGLHCGRLSITDSNHEKWVRLIHVWGSRLNYVVFSGRAVVHGSERKRQLHICLEKYQIPVPKIATDTQQSKIMRIDKQMDMWINGISTLRNGYQRCTLRISRKLWGPNATILAWGTRQKERDANWWNEVEISDYYAN